MGWVCTTSVFALIGQNPILQINRLRDAVGPETSENHLLRPPVRQDRLTDETNVKFWPVREYLVWFANR